MAFEELIIGARFYSLNANPLYAQGWFDGDIGEVLVYSRGLNDAERAQVEKYLSANNAAQNLAGRKPVPLETVPNAPPVQMLVPGFAVQELPVTLNNINDVKYRSDGKLVALGYDGRVWLLSDTDGDGFSDGHEVLRGSNPKDNTSVPNLVNPTPVIDLDATALALGSLPVWTNTGILGGVFNASTAVPSVSTVQDVRGVTFDGTANFYTGPAAPDFLTASPRGSN